MAPSVEMEMTPTQNLNNRLHLNNRWLNDIASVSRVRLSSDEQRDDKDLIPPAFAR
jgi:hypothetical protein